MTKIPSIRPWVLVLPFLMAVVSAVPSVAAKQQGLSGNLSFKGRIVQQKEWRDGSGLNRLLLTETGAFQSHKPSSEDEPPQNAELYAYQYVNNGGRWRLLWKLYDFVNDCHEDVTASYLPHSLTLTDLDGDGIKESTFLYRLGCHGDISPETLKLIMHEGRQKFAIRGTTRVKVSDTDFAGGDYKIDANLSQSSPSFRKYALDQWKRFVSIKPNW